MKNLFIPTFIILFANTVFGQNISAEIAKNAGQTFLNAKLGQTQKNSSELQLAYRSAEYYIFNAENEFIIVSATYNANPILAYSTENRFDIENIPPATQAILNGYRQQIAYLTEMQIAVKEAHQQWDNLQNGKLPKVQKANAVEPLLKNIAWGQGTQTNGMYNDFCPYDAVAGKRVPAGCNAVVMAMIMKYHNYPAKGTGSHCYEANYSVSGYGGDYGTLCADFESADYQYNLMPNQLKNTSSNAEKSAVAQLIYHCGVAVNMMYGANVSLAYGNLPDAVIGQSDGVNTYIDVRTALQTYFGYAEGIAVIEKKDYTETEWITAIKAELNKLQPINYGSNEHSYICDGYDENDFFHLNFGWTGSCNGYFHTSNIVPTEDDWHSNQTNGQYAMINIKPKYPTGIFETKSANTFKLYPNPTTGQLTIESEDLKMETVDIYDITGKFIVNCQLSIVNSIDVSHLTNGMYFLRLNGAVMRFQKE